MEKQTTENAALRYKGGLYCTHRIGLQECRYKTLGYRPVFFTFLLLSISLHRLVAVTVMAS